MSCRKAMLRGELTPESRICDRVELTQLIYTEVVVVVVVVVDYVCEMNIVFFGLYC